MIDLDLEDEQQAAASSVSGSRELVWRNAVKARAGALGRTHRELIAELQAAPEEERAGLAKQRRFWVPEVVWYLIEMSRAAGEPSSALSLLGLAQEIAVQMAADDPWRLLCAQLQVETACEMADRLRGCGRFDSAAVELRYAARFLSPELTLGRTMYWRALARLLRTQKRLQDSAAALEHALDLCEEDLAARGAELGEARAEYGWTLLEAGQAPAAVEILEDALLLVAPASRAAVFAHHGLAVALARCGRGGEAVKALAAAQALTVQLDDPGVQLDLQQAEAQVLRECGQVMPALRQLERCLRARIERGEYHEAAAVLVELLQTINAHGCASQGLPRLRLPLQQLVSSTKIHRRARLVLRFVFRLAEAGNGMAGEVLGNAASYLAASRHNTDLAFHPTSTRIEVAWSDLDPPQRTKISQDIKTLWAAAGADSSSDSAMPMLEIASWTYEVMQRVRLTFPTADE
jgi:tetratricopeptide (TPR) repeat protein